MRVVITVVGHDRVGIIAGTSGALAEVGVNIVDISQTILGEFFTMIMLAEMPEGGISIQALQEKMAGVGERLGVEVRVQHEGVFTAMHRV